MMKNKTNIFDDGYVALLSSNLDNNSLASLKKQFGYKSYTKNMLHMTYATFEIRCPLFVQLCIASHGFNILSSKNQELKAFIPTVDMINADDHETSKTIADNIQQTTDALLINPRAYQHDGCDKFMSEVISPVSVYNTFIAVGSLSQWIDFVQTDNFPTPIEAYRIAIEKQLLAEWNNLRSFIMSSR